MTGTLSGAILLFLAGVLLLVGGAWFLVSGGTRLARFFGVSQLVVGLTIVAWGTSAPELVVSLVASLRGSDDIMLGNVFGSNLANIGLILGVAVLLSPTRFDRSLWKFEIPVLVASTAAFIIFCADGALGRVEGLVLVAIFAWFTFLTLRRARRDRDTVGAAAHKRLGRGRGIMISSAMVLVGCVGLVGGSHLIVESATVLARRFGISELAIGLSLVAVGTSLPELATTVVAALRRESGIAMGNVIGSNLFNTLAVAGPVAAINPVGDATSLLSRQLPGLAAVTLVLPLMMAGRDHLGRIAGAVLLLAYAGLLTWWMDIWP